MHAAMMVKTAVKAASIAKSVISPYSLVDSAEHQRTQRVDLVAQRIGGGIALSQAGIRSIG